MRPSEEIKIIKGLIASVEFAYKANPLTDKEPHHVTDALTIAIFALEKLEKQEADRWIPVTERLPDKSKYYLVTNYIEKWGDKITETCEAFYVYNDPIYKTSYWCGSENHKLGKIIAWRPLPEPCTEKEL